MQVNLWPLLSYFADEGLSHRSWSMVEWPSVKDPLAVIHASQEVGLDNPLNPFKYMILLISSLPTEHPTHNKRLDWSQSVGFMQIFMFSWSQYYLLPFILTTVGRIPFLSTSLANKSSGSRKCSNLHYIFFPLWRAYG